MKKNVYSEISSIIIDTTNNLHIYDNYEVLRERFVKLRKILKEKAESDFYNAFADAIMEKIND